MTIADKKKIAIIFPHLERGKFEERRFERINREKFIVNRSRDEGYESELILLTFSGAIHRRDDDVGTLLFPVDNPDGHNRFNYLSTMLLNWIEKEKPDLIIFKGMGYKLNRWLVTRSSHRFKFAFIAAGSTRDPLLSYASFGLAETACQLKQCFAVLNKKEKAAMLPKLNPSHNGIYPKKKEIDVINVGSFTRLKNQKFLLPIADKYRIELVGDGPLYREVKTEAHSRGVTVLMPGNLPREEVQVQIAKSRLMVHPATSEGLPRVFMEAFACGVPVVAVRNVVNGAFTHGVHGLLVDRGDLITAAEQLLEDEEKLSELSKNALVYASENCNEESVWGVMNDMYVRVLGNNDFRTRSRWSYLSLRFTIVIYAMLNIAKKIGGRVLRIAQKIVS